MSVAAVRPPPATPSPVLLPSAARLRAALAAQPARTVERASAHAAAVLVPLFAAPQPGVLLTRRTDTLRHHAGQVCFPGGRIDPADASPEAAALREALEEIALDPAAVTLLGRLPEQITGTGYHVIPVVGLLATHAQVTPAASEVAAIFTLPLATLADPASPTRRTIKVAGATRHSWVWPHPDHTIWGATAAILMDLAALLARAALPASAA